MEPYVEPVWAVEDWLVEGESGLIVGEPKAFKSTLALDMAVSLATGKPFLNHYKVSEPVPVIYVQEENNMPIIMPQLYRLMERAGRGKEAAVDDGAGGYTKVWIPDPSVAPMEFQLSVRAGWNATADMNELVVAANAAKAKYVFIDPLYKVTNGSITHPDDVNPTLKSLSTIENETDASVVLVHHANKSNLSGGKRIMGSQLIWAWGANNIYMEKKGESGKDKYIAVQREFRGKPEPDDVRLYFEEDFHWTIEQESYDSSGKPVGERQSEDYKQFVEDCGMGDNDGLTQVQLAEKYGCTSKTIYNWRKKMKESGINSS